MQKTKQATKLTTEPTTKQAILEAGKREFLSKGFPAASLRNIVKDAGVTTGAFYGYFNSKEALFDALVSEPYATMMEKFVKARDAFAELSLEEQPEHMGDISGSFMDWMVEHIYRHLDAFRLLCSAKGTRYEHFLHSMAEIEVEATHGFFDVLRRLGRPVPQIDPQLEHILVSGMFSAFFEIVIHDMPQEQAVGYVKKLQEFYTAGWQKMMGL